MSNVLIDDEPSFWEQVESGEFDLFDPFGFGDDDLAGPGDD